ncbi:MAG: 23S rRNA (adenine1618-N6)-methyltransferase [Oleiphilaceae bacterium]|jgi:23S rRNA (adenine1618-N6)-methyltransferase
MTPRRTPRRVLSSQANKKLSGRLHPNNRHQGRYDFSKLCSKTPELTHFLKPNPHGDQTIDFSNAKAVLCLNKALLAEYYGLEFWDLPEGYLCPPIPGRADYIHHLADLIGKAKANHKARILDIGTGANLIYPIIGSQAYGWTFMASDIDASAIKAAKLIAESNINLKKKIKVVLQTNKQSFFQGVIKESDYFEAAICNPPFHSSAEQAKAGSDRKWRNLKGEHVQQTALNFGGKNSELWCEGGELAFVKGMIHESVNFQTQVGWFTSLISKAENLKPLKHVLTQLGVSEVKVIQMSQGQKVSRILAWSF